LVNTTTAARESPAKFEREYAFEMQGLPVISQHYDEKGKTAISDVTLPEGAVGRKKRRNVNCRKEYVI
jgi:hypothetical protein